MWLFTIGRHVLANHRRSSRRSEELVRRLREELAIATVPAGEGSTPMVDEAMEALAPEQRELVRLVHWEGFGVAEAGQILGVGASTARSRYATARERLRRSLSGTRDPSSTLG
jgi:RNA polymerase sigma-70 factor (ECF subfamily)